MGLEPHCTGAPGAHDVAPAQHSHDVVGLFRAQQHVVEDDHGPEGL